MGQFRAARPGKGGSAARGPLHHRICPSNLHVSPKVSSVSVRLVTQCPCSSLTSDRSESLGIILKDPLRPALCWQADSPTLRTRRGSISVFRSALDASSEIGCRRVINPLRRRGVVGAGAEPSGAREVRFMLFSLTPAGAGMCYPSETLRRGNLPLLFSVVPKGPRRSTR